MQYQQLCASHVAEIQFDEDAALAFWDRVMQQGVRLYANCRWSCAATYLTAAFEIAWVRMQACNNQMFNALHLGKPLEFLVETHIQNRTGSEAKCLIAQCRQLLREKQVRDSHEVHKMLNLLSNKLISTTSPLLKQASMSAVLH